MAAGAAFLISRGSRPRLLGGVPTVGVRRQLYGYGISAKRYFLHETGFTH
jgi:hypothetical protein